MAFPLLLVLGLAGATGVSAANIRRKDRRLSDAAAQLAAEQKAFGEAALEQGRQRAGTATEAGLAAGPQVQSSEIFGDSVKRSRIADEAQAGLNDPFIQNNQRRRDQALRGLIIETDAGFPNSDMADHWRSELKSVEDNRAKQLMTGGLATVESKRRQDNAQKQMDATFNLANQFRDERDKALAPAINSQRAFNGVRAALNEATGAGSVAAMFLFIQGLDDSVVRASEIELFSEAGGIERWLQNLGTQIAGGGLQGDLARGEMFDAAQVLALGNDQLAQGINQRFDAQLQPWEENLPGLGQLSQSSAFDSAFDYTSGRPVATTQQNAPGRVSAEGRRLRVIE